MNRISIITAVVMALTMLTASAALADGPTCSDVGLGVDVHGQHVIRDYVRDGEATNARGGAVMPGGPAAHGHFGAGVAPGASFCIAQSQSPGIHLP